LITINTRKVYCRYDKIHTFGYGKQSPVCNKRLAKKLGLGGFARFSHAGKFVIGRYEVAPQTQLFGYRQPLQTRPEKQAVKNHQPNNKKCNEPRHTKAILCQPQPTGDASAVKHLLFLSTHPLR